VIYNGSGNLTLQGGVYLTVGNTTAALDIASGGLSINTQTGAVTLDSKYGLELKSTFDVGAVWANVKTDFKNWASSLWTGTPGWKVGFSDVDIRLNPDGSLASATGTADLGEFSVGGGITFNQGEASSFSVNYTDNDVGIPLGDTGLSLSQVGGTILNLNDPSNLTVQLSASVMVDGEINLHGQYTSPLTGKGTLAVGATGLTFTGAVSVLGAAPINTTLELNSKSLSLDVNGSILDGILQYDGTVIVTAQGLTADGIASLKLPESTPQVVKDVWTAVTNSTQVFSITGHLQYLPGQAASQDFASVTLAVGSTPVIGLQIGLADGSIHATGPLGSVVGVVATQAQEDAVAVLKGCGQSVEQLAEALKAAADPSQAGVAVGTWAAVVMAKAGCSVLEIGQTLKDVFQLAYQDAGSILKSALNATVGDIATVLKNTFGLDVDTAAGYLTQVLDIAADVAQDGLTLAEYAPAAIQNAMAQLKSAADSALTDDGGSSDGQAVKAVVDWFLSL
jgi:hypothetical protein